eukprot:PhF_6_TR29062/c2_g1_i1/m.42350
MQRFDFGHPCEHQLHVTCIGGITCPLNGYPKEWCCSFIKGKINFKRDKPCEGHRCRWNFTHPTQAEFDQVTSMLNDARTMAQRLDAYDQHVENYQLPASSAATLDVLYSAGQLSKNFTRSPVPFVFGRLAALSAVKVSSVDIVATLGRWMIKHGNGGEMACGLIDQILHMCALNAGRDGGQGGGQGAILRDARHEAVRIVISLLSNGTGAGLVDRPHQGALQTAYIRGIAAHLRGRKRQEALENAAVVLKHFDATELSQKLNEEVLSKLWQPALQKAAETSPPEKSDSPTQQGTPTTQQPAVPQKQEPSTITTTTTTTKSATPSAPSTPSRQTVSLDSKEISSISSLRSPIVAPNTPSSAFSMPSPIIMGAPYTPPMPSYGPPTPYFHTPTDGALDPWAGGPILPPPVFRPEDTFRSTPILMSGSHDDGGLGAISLGPSAVNDEIDMVQLMSDLTGGMVKN